MSSGESTPPLRILFESLSGLELKEERDAFLDYTCRDNPELRSRLERMLSRRREAEGFFEIGSSSPAPDEVSEEGGGEGTRIGRYRLLGRLGEGGHGVVYLAEQQEPVKRRVALKIIRLGMDTENVIARFEMERQALAMMDHPNIARVLDAGATREGRPYFVMQLVDGEKITDYCDQKRLGIAERLRLFVRVCHAVQHAHQKGVIHRDIKPSNVLIWENEGEPVPKVIDFGIAKATETVLDPRLTCTVDGQFIGTPSYMSPEQASGSELDVDTRTDIYSLGALLYELLSGQPPFDPRHLKTAGIEGIRKMLREVEPATQSSVIDGLGPYALAELAGRRNCDPNRFAHQIKGDLERIVGKAMAKDRQRRYSGADALAADVVCYLNDEPVSARPPGRLYRLGKLVRRNKRVFAAGVLVFLSLVTGLGAATAMYFRANRAREAAEIARAAEAGLREKAEAGEKVAHAAVLINRGEILQADKLLSGVDSEVVPASLETANTYRAVAEWLLREGRREAAAARFAVVAEAISRVDKSDSESVTIHFVAAAAAVLDADDVAHYEELRHMAAERFSMASHPIIADEVVKTCLLAPADPEMLRQLEPLIGIIEGNVRWDRDDLPGEFMEAWQMLSMALAGYRSGDLSTAESWARRCLRHPDVIPARSAAVNAVLAMALERSGHPEEARRAVERSRDAVGGYFGQPTIDPDSNEGGFWFDWMIARILLREADALMEG
jgi:serine/threonine protein kinase